MVVTSQLTKTPAVLWSQLLRYVVILNKATPPRTVVPVGFGRGQGYVFSSYETFVDLVRLCKHLSRIRLSMQEHLVCL